MFILLFILTLVFIALAGYNLIIEQPNASMVYIFIMQAGQIQRKLSYALREKAFKRLHELPFSYYDKTPVGWIMARMTSDSRNLSEILSWGLIDLTWGLLMMIGITIVTVSYTHLTLPTNREV